MSRSPDSSATTGVSDLDLPGHDASSPASTPQRSEAGRLRRAGGTVVRRLSALRHGLRARAEHLSAGQRRTVLLLLGAVTVLVTTTAILLTMWRAGEVSARQQEADALAASRTRTEQVLSFDNRTLDADVARARESVAGAFADQYSQISRSIIETAGRQLGTTIRTRIERAAVVGTRRESDSAEITILLYATQDVSSAGAPPRTSPVQLEVVMTEVGGQWLVSGLRPL